MNWTLNIDSLFKAAGLKTKGQVIMNKNSYDFDPNDPKSSWLYPVFLGFKELKKSSFKPKIFATIGTGSGIDSIGEFEIFKSKKIFQVDVHPNIPEIADYNAKSIIGKKAEIQTFLGDLCNPLIERGLKADLVYANIPNIPSDQPGFKNKQGASMYVQRSPEDCPKIFQKYYLTLQYLFLKEAKKILKPGGKVVDAIGSRVPQEILEDIFKGNGYKVEELVSVYKIQSEPEDTLEGYAKAETQFNIEFEFYRHTEAQKLWEKVQNKKLNTYQLKELLKPHQINATTALEEYLTKQKVPGHICSILCGAL